MEYISAKQAARNWNISQRRVLALCADGRIENLVRIGNMWLIPCNTEKPVDGRSLRYDKVQIKSFKPFVKWAGGKGQLLSDIRRIYPEGLGKTITKYAEPFVGGGAVLFDILSNYHLDEVYISDCNVELMNTYSMIRNNVDELVDLLSAMQAEYHMLDTVAQKDYFYAKRNRFNMIKSIVGGAQGIEGAALFIFLNRTCFNGLYRVNSKGQFNVPIGSYKRPLICDNETLLNVSHALQNVTIVCGDYKESASFIDAKTFVYFDPPYRPLNSTSGFTSYTEGRFGDIEQIELAKFMSEMDFRGAKVVLSNSDPKNTNEEDNFFDELYRKHSIRRVSAARAINSKSSSRGKINELLICNF